ncbi:MAG: hypothetical protein C5B59_01375 [Bacteroidetes bacterium]|nr:MAG: hypothetical protein C5B59_01375 [Bacteroidota bacterium]
MNTTDQDITVWQEFRHGDREAFAILFRKYYGSLFLFGSKFLTDKQLLEDAIQELFIELWQAKSQTHVVSVKAYLLKSLKYKLLKIIRRENQAQLLNENEHSFFEWSHENFLIARQDDQERKQHVLKAISYLSNRQKEIIYLKFYQNLSYEEVSDIMNINYQVARNLLCQAIKTLKKFLSQTIGIALVLF